MMRDACVSAGRVQVFSHTVYEIRDQAFPTVRCWGRGVGSQLSNGQRCADTKSHGWVGFVVFCCVLFCVTFQTGVWVDLGVSSAPRVHILKTLTQLQGPPEGAIKSVVGV